MRLLDDERGQSVQVGAAILLGFVVIAITIYQVQVVSSQNAEVEFNHNQEVRGDMTELRNSIHNAGTTGTSTAVAVNLGTQYPPRTIFLNPPPPRGIFRTESIGNISISNTTVSDDVDYSGDADPQDILDEPHATSRIAYTPDYAEFDGTPTTVVEHSLGFNTFDNNVSDPITPQGVVNGDSITLTVLRGNVSEQGSSAVSIDPRTVTATDEIEITSQGGPITLDLPTDTPAVWNETLGETYDAGESDARVASWNPATNTIRVALDQSEYTFQIAMVGVGNGVPLSDRYDVERVDGSGSGGGGGQGSYSLNWADPEDSDGGDPALSDCDSESCTWDVGASDDDTLDLSASLDPAFEDTELAFDLNNSNVASIDPPTGTTGPDGAAQTELTANQNGPVSVRATTDGAGDVIEILVENVSNGGGGGGTTSGEQTSYVGGSGSAARSGQESRLDFDIQNTGSTDVTITSVSIDMPNGNNLHTIYENNGGAGAGQHEVYFDASTPGWLETGDGGSEYQLGTTASLTQAATLSSGEQVQVTALDFRNNGGQPSSVADREVSVTLTLQDGSTTAFSFTPPGY